MWDSSTIDHLDEFPTISEMLEEFSGGAPISDLEPAVNSEPYTVSAYDYEEASEVMESWGTPIIERKPFDFPEQFQSLHRRVESQTSANNEEDYSDLMSKLEILSMQVGELTALSKEIYGNTRKREPSYHKRNPSNHRDSTTPTSRPHSATNSLVSSASSLQFESLSRRPLAFAADYNESENDPSATRKMEEIRDKVSRKLDRKKSQHQNPLVPRKKEEGRAHDSSMNLELEHLRKPIPVSPPTPSKKKNRRTTKSLTSLGDCKQLDALLGPVTPELPPHLQKSHRVCLLHVVGGKSRKYQAREPYTPT